LDNNPLNIIGAANPINPFSKPLPSIPALLVSLSYPMKIKSADYYFRQKEAGLFLFFQQTDQVGKIVLI
jgi:hypothetical protein